MPEASKREKRARSAPSPVRAIESEAADVRVAVLTPIPQLLREMDCDPARVLASVGLDLSIFDDPERRVSFVTGGALLQSCAATSGIPHFGLLVGERFDLSMLGILGQLLRSSDNLHTALQQLVRHLHLNDRGAVGYMVDLNRDGLALGYAIYRNDTPGIDQVYDMSIAIVVGIVRSLCGLDWKPTLVSFSHHAPSDLAPYKRHFRSPLRFDAAHSEVIVGTRWLDRPMLGADTHLRVAAERVALLAEQGDDGRLVDRVRQVVHRLLMTGDVSSKRISALLNINERVLRRRLEAKGIGIRELIANAQFDSACQLLRSTRLTLADIATALGYSDATAFSRAFRRLAQTTPSAWRAQSYDTTTGSVAIQEKALSGTRQQRSSKRPSG
jgi:AraC-like DNA-binding protein